MAKAERAELASKRGKGKFSLAPAVARWASSRPVAVIAAGKAVLAASRSGRELIDKGYPDDIDLAADLDADEVVPLLTGNAFTLASP